MSRLLERFRRDVMGVLFLAGGLFITLSLISYAPSDPSFTTFSKNADKIKNWCGLVGSFLSELLYSSLGVVSWMLVFFAFRLAMKNFMGQTPKLQKIKLIWALLLLIIMSTLTALHFPQAKIFEGEVALGGGLGLLISHGLTSLFNTIGVAVILWSGLIALTVFYTEKPLSQMLPRLSYIKESFESLSGLFTAQKNLDEMETIEPAAAPAGESALAKIEERVKSKFSLIHKSKERPTKIQRPPTQIENWRLPAIDLLKEAENVGKKADEKEITRNARLVEQKLAEFDVTGQVVEVKPGPAVTMYEFKPAASVKINEITKLADDLSLALSAESLRIIAPIPGRDVVGIETSNSYRQNIAMRDLLETPEFWSPEIRLPVAIGKGVTGESKIIDLRRLPHLLVAGTTGSGKSVFVMSLVTSLIMRHSPKTLKLIIVDPKQVDLAAFHKIPHLLMPPVKEVRPAINTLKWLVREMEKRYRSMSQFGCKNIEAYNETVEKLTEEERKKHEARINAFESNPETKAQSYYLKSLPYIVAVIEEFADLMSVDRVGVEPVVVRLAQMARASGIHLVLAMQSPRREVLTGLIKTNFPGRISFKVASKIDSTIILDSRGAERLLSVGDMLYLAPGFSQPQRYHGAYLQDSEITAVTDFWMAQGEPQFEQTAIQTLAASEDHSLGTEGLDDPEFNQEYDRVLSYVATQKEISASLIQRRFNYGYPKAARYIDMLETEGVVGPKNGSKPRQVLANRLD